MMSPKLWTTIRDLGHLSTLAVNRTTMPVLFLYSIHDPRTALALPPSSNSAPGSRSGPFSPFPLPYVPSCHFYREKTSAFSSLVDPRGVVVVVVVVVVVFFSHCYFLASGQAVVTGVVPSSHRFLPSIFITHRVQQSHCWSIFHPVLLTHALALSVSHFLHKKRSQRIYTSMHSGKFELTKLTYTRLGDNLIFIHFFFSHASTFQLLDKPW